MVELQFRLVGRAETTPAHRWSRTPDSSGFDMLNHPTL